MNRPSLASLQQAVASISERHEDFVRHGYVQDDREALATLATLQLAQLAELRRLGRMLRRLVDPSAGYELHWRTGAPMGQEPPVHLKATTREAAVEEALQVVRQRDHDTSRSWAASLRRNGQPLALVTAQGAVAYGSASTPEGTTTP